MKREEILNAIKDWSDSNAINPYAYYSIMHDEKYAEENWFPILDECKDANELYKQVSAIFA